MPVMPIPGDLIGTNTYEFDADNLGEDVVAQSQVNKLILQEKSDAGTQAFLINDPANSSGQSRRAAGGVYVFYKGPLNRYKAGEVAGRITLVNAASVRFVQKESVSDTNSPD